MASRFLVSFLLLRAPVRSLERVSESSRSHIRTEEGGPSPLVSATARPPLRTAATGAPNTPSRARPRTSRGATHGPFAATQCAGAWTLGGTIRLASGALRRALQVRMLAPLANTRASPASVCAAGFATSTMQRSRRLDSAVRTSPRIVPRCCIRATSASRTIRAG